METIMGNATDITVTTLKAVAALAVMVLLVTATILARPSTALAQQAVTGDPIPGVPGYGVDLGLDPATGNIVELLVYRGQKQVQALKVCTADPVPRQSPIGTMDTADFNFDGHGDLLLETAFKDGNASYCIWLFNPKAKRFVFSQQLSQLTNPRPDPKTRTVASYSKLECEPCYQKQIFRWSKGQLVPVGEESVKPADLGLQLGGGCGWLRTVRQEKNGQMVFVSRDQVNSLGQVCTP